ncbi:RecB family exonuclease [Streptomyces sp. NPDC048514]|uniref:RecB family exonuclease n=1 Tax=Streptomyces sp. NPDC048514 TaxID=3365564 RepID=UPI003717AF2D
MPSQPTPAGPERPAPASTPSPSTPPATEPVARAATADGAAPETAGGAEAEGTATAGHADPDGTATAGRAEPDGTATAGRAEPDGTAAGGAGAGGAGGDRDGVVGGRVAVAPSSLSPSRASDFMQCPLLYRFRVIDRLPEKPSEAATRGTLVHAVLERLFDAPAGERTAPRAKALVPGQWDRLRESRPELTELFAGDPEGGRLARWLEEAERLVERWFTLEDPTRLEPAERELFVEAELESGLRLRGIIDRVDVAPTGDVRIVDYKTGKAPRPEYAEGALFQMKFYALVVWRLKRVIPRRLQLVYLGSGDVLTYDPVLADLERVERKLHALWEAIRQATETGVWRPRPTKLCGWCDHQAHCPEFGGTPPPYPLPVRAPGSATG